MKWRYINAGVPGTSHRHQHLPCQDSCFVEVVPSVENQDILVAVVSDGAGTASQAQDGSEGCCRIIIDEAQKFLSKKSLSDLTRIEIESWIRSVRSGLTATAEKGNLSLRDYACTFVLAIVGESDSVYAQIGDGAIVICESENYTPVFWPESGEYANMTHFITDDEFAERLHYCSKTSSTNRIALFTDGIQRLALRYDIRTAHAPFFVPMFEKLRQESPGYSDSLTLALETFLSSSAVNARTDDDKTLVLGVRA